MRISDWSSDVCSSDLREERAPKPAESAPRERLRVEGGINLLLLAGIVGAVLMSGAWHPGIGFEIYHVEIELQNLLRDLLLIAIAFLSLKQIGRASCREGVCQQA